MCPTLIVNKEDGVLDTGNSVTNNLLPDSTYCIQLLPVYPHIAKTPVLFRD